MLRIFKVKRVKSIKDCEPEKEENNLIVIGSINFLLFLLV